MGSVNLSRRFLFPIGGSSFHLILTSVEDKTLQIPCAITT